MRYAGYAHKISASASPAGGEPTQAGATGAPAGATGALAATCCV